VGAAVFREVIAPGGAGPADAHALLLGGDGVIEPEDPWGGVGAGGVHVDAAVVRSVQAQPLGEDRLDHDGACGRHVQNRRCGGVRVPLSGRGWQRPNVPMTRRAVSRTFDLDTRAEGRSRCCDFCVNAGGYRIAGASARRTLTVKDSGFVAAAAVTGAGARYPDRPMFRTCVTTRSPRRRCGCHEALATGPH
jgi:hypothetical protein